MIKSIGITYDVTGLDAHEVLEKVAEKIFDVIHLHGAPSVIEYLDYDIHNQEFHIGLKNG